MCTCISTPRFFGRTLDVETSYHEHVVLLPREFPLSFRHGGKLDTHYAVIGTAHVEDGYPLYYDAMNEHGLCIAGLHFVESCKYFPKQSGKDNIAPFELPLWLLAQCTSVAEAIPLLKRLNIWDEAFSEALPQTPLHWLLADAESSLVIESGKSGLLLHENAVGALANDPPFPAQMANLQSFSPDDRAWGLPGDFSSESRFQRAVYGVENAPAETMAQFFGILDLLAVPRGCVRVSGRDHYTVYTGCCDRKAGIYAYTTCTQRRITRVTLQNFYLSGKTLLQFPHEKEAIQ